MERYLIINDDRYSIVELTNDGLQFKVILDDTTGIKEKDKGKLWGQTKSGFLVLDFNITITEINKEENYVIADL